MTLIECGIVEHEATCLCDVHVTEETPINYGLHELDHADLVIKYYSLSRPWTADQLTILLSGLDRARQARDMMRDNNLEPGKLSTYTDTVKGLIVQGQSMVDIPSLLGLSLADTATALMSGRPSIVSTWSEAGWLGFEADVLNGVGSNVLARKHRLSISVARRLQRLYLDRT